jgi:hypothetical protein
MRAHATCAAACVAHIRRPCRREPVGGLGAQLQSCEGAAVYPTTGVLAEPYDVRDQAPISPCPPHLVRAVWDTCKRGDVRVGAGRGCRLV